MSDTDEIETGLAGLTATVTDPIAVGTSFAAPETAVTPASAPDPVPARAMPDGWTLHKVAALVSDVAQNMYELPYILKKHELTAGQYKTLEKNPFFQRALEAEIITWQGANSIQKRLMLEAAIAVEEGMPYLAARLQNKAEPLGEVVMLMKLFAEIAGVIGAKAITGPQAFGERFKIVINMGGTKSETEATPSVNINQTIEHVA